MKTSPASPPLSFVPDPAVAPVFDAPLLSPKAVQIFDTTLRDGEQAEGVNFSLQDKLAIAHMLDDFGVDYIEGGWPGSNPKAVDFFREIAHHPMKRARLTAFGSTRRKDVRVQDDPQLRLLLDSRAPVCCIFGKSWDFQVTDALLARLEDNLAMIGESVAWLRAHDREVIYDAEHFFDGYKSNARYALDCLKAAAGAGARTIVLCDTNGGTLPHEVTEIVKVVRAELPDVVLGIHAHDDSGCGVANSLAAVQAGCNHVQGTINGYGERCGNANLTSIIPNLVLKLKLEAIAPARMQELRALSHAVDEIANLVPNTRAPYVGMSAFAHKGGIHVSAIRRNRACYEHIEPERVGNRTRVLVSELSGVSNLHSKREEMGLEVDGDSMRQALEQIKQMENEGYCFEAAEASLELLMHRSSGKYAPHFELVEARTTIDKRGHDAVPVTEATLKARVGREVIHTVSDGDGPVDALNGALLKALQGHYPALGRIRLLDFKVRVMDARTGTAAKVRVLIRSGADEETWSTVGVSENIIQASWEALVDSYEYFLLRSEETNKHSREVAAIEA